MFVEANHIFERKRAIGLKKFFEVRNIMVFNPLLIYFDLEMNSIFRVIFAEACNPILFCDKVLKERFVIFDPAANR